MKRAGIMETNWTPWAQGLLALVLSICLTSCTNKTPTVPETEYPAKIIGHWQGTVGGVKEDMSFDQNGTFVGQLRSVGFIANTLSQSAPGIVRDTWKISGTTVTLIITGAENEAFKNRNASSEIIEFHEDEIVLKSSRGDTSTFRRVLAL